MVYNDEKKYISLVRYLHNRSQAATLVSCASKIVLCELVKWLLQKIDKKKMLVAVSIMIKCQVLMVYYL